MLAPWMLLWSACLPQTLDVVTSLWLHVLVPSTVLPDYAEKYYLDYKENTAHSLGVMKIIRVLRDKLSKPV